MHSDFVAALLGREVRTSTPTIKQFRVPRGSSFDLVPEGTIGLAVSNDKQVLRNLGDAIGGADFTSAAKTAGKLQARQRRLLLRDRRVVASLTDVPNFGELRYSGTPLVQGVFLAGRVPLVVSTIMYSGAQLDPQRFEFVEKFRRPATADDAMFCVGYGSRTRTQPAREQGPRECPSFLGGPGIPSWRVCIFHASRRNGHASYLPDWTYWR